MAYTAGAASVPITPNFTSFHRDIGAQLDKEDASFAKAGDRWGKLSADSFKASFGKLAPAVTPKVDGEKARTELDGLARDRKPGVTPKVDDAAARTDLDTLTRPRKVTVTVDTSSVKKAAKSFGESLAGLKIPALATAAIGLAPSALGGAAAAVGGGLALGTAAAGVASFAAIAVPMFTKVTKAQTALTTATAAYAKATTKTAKASALKAEAAATDGLTSSEKKLAVELDSLKTGWTKLQDSEENTTGRALVPWFSAASESLRFLPSLIGPASNAIGALGDEAKTSLQAPFWKTFFGTLGSLGEESLTGFGDALGHVGDAFAHLFVTFAPDIGKLPGLINGWARSFDTWSQSVTRAGFDKWLNGVFSHKNLSTLGGDLQSLGTVFGNVAQATQQMSPAAFEGLSNVLSILAKLSPGQIEALALIYGGSKVAGNASSLAGLLGSLGGAGGGKSSSKGKTAAGGSTAAGGFSLGSLLSKGVIAVTVAGAVQSLLKGVSSGPGGKNWLDNPFGTNGKNSKNPSGWNSFPQAGKNIENWGGNDPANWSTTGWSEAYTHFQRDFAGKITAWFTQSLPHFFTSTVPGAWSWAYTGFERNVGSPIAGFFTRTLPSFFSGIGSGLGGVGSAFGSEGSQLGHSLASGLSTGWSASAGFVTRTFSAAKGWAAGAFRGSESWLSGAGSSVAHGVGTGYQSAAGWVSGVASHGKGWVTGAYRGASGWLTGTGSSVAHGLGSGYQSASGWVAGVASRGKGWITGAYRGAGGWLGGTGSSIAHGLGGGYQSAAGYVSGVAGRARGWVAGAFGGAGSWLWGAGSSVISGFVSGLEAGFGRVESVLSSLSSKIPSWKGPPAYDAVMLRPAGQLIMGGLENSLAAGIPGVRAVMGQATAAIGAGLNVPSVSLPSLPRAGSDGAQLTVNLTASGDSPLMAAIIKGIRADVQSAAGGDVQAHLGKGKVRT